MRYRTSLSLFALFFFCLLFGVQSGLQAQIRMGAERMEIYLPLLIDKRVALVANHTSLVDRTHLLDTLLAHKVCVRLVFTPEHGFRGEADAGEYVNNGTDSRTGIPIISLYGENRKPQPAQLRETDVVVFDIQDVGARFYTYISTLYYVMQACAENGKELIVLDRPNPCDYVDGPVREATYTSFVGILPVPVLHGCTVGEIARMANSEGWLGKELHCSLQVVPVEGWKHGQPYALPVKPSPNLPDTRAVAFYASLCPFEGTSVSVGRGTEAPFQVLGSPFLAGMSFLPSTYVFTPEALPGARTPLHLGKKCYGIDLRGIPDFPHGFTLEYVMYFYARYKEAGMANRFFTRPEWFDLLMGTSSVRLGILKGKTETEIRNEWEPALLRYKEMRERYLLY